MVWTDTDPEDIPLTEFLCVSCLKSRLIDSSLLLVTLSQVGQRSCVLLNCT